MASVQAIATGAGGHEQLSTLWTLQSRVAVIKRKIKRNFGRMQAHLKWPRLAAAGRITCQQRARPKFARKHLEILTGRLECKPRRNIRTRSAAARHTLMRHAAWQDVSRKGRNHCRARDPSEPSSSHCRPPPAKQTHAERVRTITRAA